MENVRQQKFSHQLIQQVGFQRTSWEFNMELVYQIFKLIFKSEIVSTNFTIF